MGSARTAKKAAAAPPADDAPAVSPTDTDPTPDAEVEATTTDAGGSTFAVEVTGHEDGPITFTRPGIESKDFVLEGGRITTTKERAEWLVNYTEATPVSEKE